MKTKFLKQACALALCGVLVFGNNIMSYASVKDNVGGMDTSVDSSSTDKNGNTATQGSATADKILKGYGAWVNGDLVVGTIPNMVGKTIKYPDAANINNDVTITDTDIDLSTFNKITEIDNQAIIKVPTGYYNEKSVLSIPVDTIKKQVSSLNSSSYQILNSVQKGKFGHTTDSNNIDVSITATQSCYAMAFGCGFGNGGNCSSSAVGTYEKLFEITNTSLSYGITYVAIYKIQKNTTITCNAFNGISSYGSSYNEVKIVLYK